MGILEYIIVISAVVAAGAYLLLAALRRWRAGAWGGRPGDYPGCSEDCESCNYYKPGVTPDNCDERNPGSHADDNSRER